VGKTTKTFVVRVGKTRTIKSLGRYPEISLSEARKQAKKILAISSFTSSLNYTDAVTAFLEDSRSRNSPKTVREYERYLRAFESPRRVNDVTRADIQLELSKYKGKPSSHQHAVVAFKVFFNYCVRMELADKNPALGERTPKIPARDRVLTPDELKAVYNYEDGQFSDILKLCIRTGQRRSEIVKIHSDWIDGNKLTIPAGVAKNRRKHTIPLSNTSLSLLRGEGNIFGNDKGTYFSGWGKSKARMDKVIEIPHWTIHDLRRVFATFHIECGTDVPVVESILNHSSGVVSGVSAIYIRHDYFKQMKKAQKKYEKALDDIVKS
jgi:integrase